MVRSEGRSPANAGIEAEPQRPPRRLLVVSPGHFRARSSPAPPASVPGSRAECWAGVQELSVSPRFGDACQPLDGGTSPRCLVPVTDHPAGLPLLDEPHPVPIGSRRGRTHVPARGVDPRLQPPPAALAPDRDGAGRRDPVLAARHARHHAAPAPRAHRARHRARRPRRPARRRAQARPSRRSPPLGHDVAAARRVDGVDDRRHRAARVGPHRPCSGQRPAARRRPRPDRSRPRLRRPGR